MSGPRSSAGNSWLGCDAANVSGTGTPAARSTRNVTTRSRSSAETGYGLSSRAPAPCRSAATLIARSLRLFRTKRSWSRLTRATSINSSPRCSGSAVAPHCRSHVTTPLPLSDGPRDHEPADSMQRDDDATPSLRSQFGARRLEQAARTGAVAWRYDTALGLTTLCDMAHVLTRRRFLTTTGGVLAVAALGDGFIREPVAIEVTRHDLAIPGLDRRLAGLRLACVTDVHLHRAFSRAARATLALLERERPDVVLLVGDICNSRRDLPVLGDWARAARGRAATFATLGNWEHDGGIDRGRGERTYGAAGVELLYNSSARLSIRGAELDRKRVV